MTVFYFSSTGNCLYLGKKIGGTLASIPRAMMKGQLRFTDDVIGIVCPCYYFGIPRPVERFLRAAAFRCDYAFGIVSYGNFSGGAAHQLWKKAKKNGLELSYVTDILMVDNYVPLFDMKEQLGKLPEKNVEKNLAEIVSDLSNRREYRKQSGLLSKLMTPPAQIFYRFRLRNADLRFSIEDSCNNCRICEKVCPVQNITVTNGPEFRHKCEECLGCTHNCPQNAIRVRGEKSRDRFVNEHVRTGELFLNSEKD